MMFAAPSKRLVFIAPVLIPLLAVLAGCGGETTAPAGDAPPVLAERHDNFEAISDNFKAIRAQLEGESPDLAAIEAAAIDINQRAERISGHFPEGTGRDAGWDTEALPTIWEKPEEFTAAQQKLLEESAAMMTLAASGDAAAVGAQVAELGGACKNCHDTFRLDDD
ncbi:c-type cytochrome [Qipengyuania sp. ASV99]|uniref:c-type cytochrome n=1 Tax=Qipengyuania sp. ASV99 TaxID=3399681 RepID=UPI003A4C81B9